MVDCKFKQENIINIVNDIFACSDCFFYVSFESISVYIYRALNFHVIKYLFKRFKIRIQNFALLNEIKNFISFSISH